MNETCVFTEEEAIHYLSIASYTIAGVVILCCGCLVRKVCCK